MPRGSQVESSTAAERRFDLLFNSHHDIVFRYCVRRLGIDEADDAAADVFAVAWRRLEDIPSEDHARAWLIGVAYKVVGNRYRARRRQLRLWKRLASAEGDGREHREARDLGDPELSSLYTALLGLSETDQELLRLSAWEDLSRIEIAHVLDINENAVDQRLHRARSRLKERLARPEDSSNQPREART